MEFTYNYSLVSFSVIIAVITSFAALEFISRIYNSGRASTAWLAGASAVIGTGIWSMHFIGMLAVHLPIELTYDAGITVLSVCIAITASFLSIYVFTKLKIKYSTEISSAVMGAGISAMHYTGMASIPVVPPLTFSWPLVILSVLIAVAASYFALKISSTASKIPSLFEKKNLPGAVILGIAISGMHYTGMFAAYFDPLSVCSSGRTNLDTESLAIVTAMIAFFIASIAVLMLSFDSKIANQNAEMVRKLKEHNDNLQIEASALAESITKQISEGARKDRMLAAVIDQAYLAIITIDSERVISSWNKSAEKMFGYQSIEVLGKNLESVLRKAEEEECEIEYEDILDKDNIHLMRYRHNTGRIVYVNVQSSPLYSEDSQMIGSILMIRDVTSLHEYHKHLALWTSVYKHSSEGIIITNKDNKIVSINNAFSTITGYKFDEIQGKDPRVLSSGMMNRDFYNDLWKELSEKGRWNGEIWNKRKNGEIYPEWIQISALRGTNGKVCNYMAIFTDATEYKKKEEAIKHMAYHDVLTDLPNRTLMEDRIQMEIAHSERMHNHFAVLFMDLDNFKHLNDTFGHLLGDRLLKEVANRLTNSVRVDDTVSRIGGDEFVVMIRDFTNIEVVAKVAKKIIKNISDEFSIGNDKFKITPSVGISVYPDDGRNCDELLRNADAAMYHAKALGRANFQFFTQELNDVIARKKQIEKALETAVQNQEFQIYYQPQISISEKKVVGGEALLRWFHPEMGKISPAKFIPIAEESGLIYEIGKWQIEKTLEQLEEWSHIIPDFSQMNFSLNLSVHQLEKENFVETFRTALERITFPHQVLELEILETALMKNTQYVLSTLKKLKELNVKITIDDFGSGYTSLNHLKKMPVDRIKIDRSFVSDIAEGNNASYAEAIVRLAQTLDLTVIAEGAENREHEDFLLKAGCDVVQGFYYSRAVSPDEFIQFMQEYCK